MKNCEWESIDDFHSLIEFERFEKWLNEEITTGKAVETPVTNPYLGEYASFEEKQFRHVTSGKIWRLVWPDVPFKGLFNPSNKIKRISERRVCKMLYLAHQTIVKTRWANCVCTTLQKSTSSVGRISLRNPPHDNISFGAIRYAIDALQNKPGRVGSWTHAGRPCNSHRAGLKPHLTQNSKACKFNFVGFFNDCGCGLILAHGAHAILFSQRQF